MSWSKVPLGKVCDRIYSGGTPSTKNPAFFNGDIPWVTSKDMKTQFIGESQIRITQAGVDNSSAKMVPAGSLLMVVRSGILKHTLPVAVTTRDVAINQDIKALIPKKGVYANYLLYSILASADQLLKKVRATTADNIELEEIVKLQIALPPLSEQYRLAAEIERKLASVAKAKKAAEEQMRIINAMPASILRNVLNGNI